MAGTGVINHGLWQSDKRGCEADWKEKLLWRVCDGMEALTTSVNKGHHLAEADSSSSPRLNLPWKAITATLLASSWPSPLLSFPSGSQSNSQSPGPRWPSDTNSEMSSHLVADVAADWGVGASQSGGPSAGHSGTYSKRVFSSDPRAVWVGL